MLLTTAQQEQTRQKFDFVSFVDMGFRMLY